MTTPVDGPHWIGRVTMETVSAEADARGLWISERAVIESTDPVSYIVWEGATLQDSITLFESTDLNEVRRFVLSRDERSRS